MLCNLGSSSTQMFRSQIRYTIPIEAFGASYHHSWIRGPSEESQAELPQSNPARLCEASLLRGLPALGHSEPVPRVAMKALKMNDTHMDL